ncbi:mob kinase activator-like 1 [Anaeramoeba flamelloides]|uniref:Mob kinase activator-like n=1 Tax=Anaeramoeba flamelloides TaxID=1746091 RepID=A0AAV7YB08_9EUKA|nr:mob kinase activator-like [Anaeramoeba flamelloides]KAJ6241462.1 mob kinase activator-like 1 [Anaeramoeba flamelloides]
MNIFKKSSTFRAKRRIKEQGKQNELKKYAEATLGSGNLRLAVQLPEGEDQNEWLASNTVDFFNQINMLYGTITEFCTCENCPLMNAGPKYEYFWAETRNKKKALLKLSAPEYIDKLMTWIQSLLDNEQIFPSQMGESFPNNFLPVVKTILKRLFRVFAHIYHNHFTQIATLGAEAHLNTSFKHFIFFVNEFKLINRTELKPLEGLVDSLLKKKK